MPSPVVFPCALLFEPSMVENCIQYRANLLLLVPKMPDSCVITHISQVPQDLVRKYIDGCHILHYHDLVDAYGHPSVRLSDTIYLMSRYLAPALVASPDDLVLHKVEDGEPVSPSAPRGT
jgi:hypothetical protein